MHKNPSMGIRGPAPEINRFPGLVDPRKASGLVWDSEEIFREVEVLRMAVVRSRIMGEAGPDKVLVIACGSSQVSESSIISEVAE